MNPRNKEFWDGLSASQQEQVYQNLLLFQHAEGSNYNQLVEQTKTGLRDALEHLSKLEIQNEKQLQIDLDANRNKVVWEQGFEMLKDVLPTKWKAVVDGLAAENLGDALKDMVPGLSLEKARQQGNERQGQIIDEYKDEAEWIDKHQDVFQDKLSSTGTWSFSADNQEQLDYARQQRPDLAKREDALSQNAKQELQQYLQEQERVNESLDKFNNETAPSMYPTQATPTTTAASEPVSDAQVEVGEGAEAPASFGPTAESVGAVDAVPADDFADRFGGISEGLGRLRGNIS